MTGGQKFIKNKHYMVYHPKMKVTAAECKLCGDIVFSRCRHDKRYCSCGNIVIDGGIDSTYIAWRKKKPEFFKLRIVQTKHQLYDDWNTSTNNFGLFPMSLRKFVNKKLRVVHNSRPTEGNAGRKLGRIYKAR